MAFRTCSVIDSLSALDLALLHGAAGRVNGRQVTVKLHTNQRTSGTLNVNK